MTTRWEPALGAGAVALLVLLALAPAAQSHAAPDPLENEVHLLADEGEDAFYWYDGYDLYNLFVREAHWQPTGEDGLIFRYTLYGGFSEAPAANELHTDITVSGPDGPTTLRMTTENDRNWTGQLTLVNLNVTEDSLPYTGVTAKIQAFVPYSALNVSVGDVISQATMASLADDDLRDIAPGGIFLPMSGGMAEVPAESLRVTDEVPLVGPTTYFDATTAVQGSTLTVTIENAFEASGQHVGVVPGDVPGWTAESLTPMAASIDGGESVTMELNLSAAPETTAPLPIEVHSDLGGREVLYIGINGTELMVADQAETLTVNAVQEPQESPGLGVVLASLSTLGAALVARRR